MLYATPTKCFIKNQKQHSITKSILLPSVQWFVLSVENKHLLITKNHISLLPLDLQYSVFPRNRRENNTNNISQIPVLLISYHQSQHGYLHASWVGRASTISLKKFSEVQHLGYIQRHEWKEPAVKTYWPLISVSAPILFGLSHYFNPAFLYYGCSCDRMWV